MSALLIGGIIGAIAGAFAGGISTLDQARKQKNERRIRENQLKYQKEAAWRSYLLNKDYTDTQWDLGKDEALSQLALREYRLGAAVDRSMGQYNTALAGQALGLQDARIQSAGSIGAMLAREGAGGVRGSSSSGLIQSYQEQSLQRQAALQDRGNRDSLYAMLAGASEAREDIGLERASWKEGGYKALLKAAQDEHNLAAAKLEQENLQKGIDTQSALFDATKINGLDYLTSFLSGSGSGWNMGSNIAAASTYSNGSDGSGGSGGNTRNSFDEVGGAPSDYRVKF
jgi:hypothetical protein